MSKLVAKLRFFALAALLASTVAVLGDEGVTDAGAGAAGNPAASACQDWFQGYKDDMEECQDGLGEVSAQLEDRSTCPPDCTRRFQGMPPPCLGYVETAMAGERPEAFGWTAINSSAFDVCDLLQCSAQQCSITPSAIAVLNKFFALLDRGNPAWGPGPPAPATRGSATSVGIIVGAVIAGNVVFVAGLALVMMVRRRRRQRRLQQAGSGQPQQAGSSQPDPEGSECCGTGVTASVEEGLADSAQRGGVLKPDGTRKGIAVRAAAAPPSGPPGGAEGDALQAHAPAAGGMSGDGGMAAPGLPPPPEALQDDSVHGVAELWAGALGAAAIAGGAAASMGAAAHVGSDAAASSQADSAALRPEPAASKADDMQQDEQEMMGLHSSAAATPLAVDSRAQLLPSYETSSQPGAGAGSTSGAELGGQEAPPGVSCAPSGAAVAVPRLSGSQGLVDLEPWRIRYSSLALQRRLGEGSFGTVHLAKWNETLVAVKLLTGVEAEAAAQAASSSSSSSSLCQPLSEALEKEAGLMASLRHPNVTLFIGVCAQPPALVTEYCSRGSLLDVLRAARMSQAAASALTWVRRLSMALDAAKGMLCLHAHVPPIIHRDLKSPNLLVDAAWRVKVADFNLSKLMDLEGVQSSTKHGLLNPRWLAPEVLLGLPATAASDVFSMGVVMWEVLTWRLPWEEEGRNAFQLLHMITHGERPPVPAREAVPGPDQLSESEYGQYVLLMQRCWAQEPAARPSFAELIIDLRSIMAQAVGITMAD